MEPTSSRDRCSATCRSRSGCRQDHPLRAIRRITDRALERLSPRFGTLYVKFGRPSIPPEKLLRALLLQALYTIRSERQLMEQLDYNLLFRWFVGLGMDDAGLGADDVHQESRSLAGRRHRRGVLRGGVAPCRHRAAALGRPLHRRRDAAGGVGQSEKLPAARRGPAGRRRRQSDGEFPWPAAHATTTHQSTTDPDARLYKKAHGPRGAPRRIWATC